MHPSSPGGPPSGGAPPKMAKVAKDPVAKAPGGAPVKVVPIKKVAKEASASAINPPNASPAPKTDEQQQAPSPFKVTLRSTNKLSASAQSVPSPPSPAVTNAPVQGGSSPQSPLKRPGKPLPSNPPSEPPASAASSTTASPTPARLGARPFAAGASASSPEIKLVGVGRARAAGPVASSPPPPAQFAKKLPTTPTGAAFKSSPSLRGSAVKESALSSTLPPPPPPAAVLSDVIESMPPPPPPFMPADDETVEIQPESEEEVVSGPPPPIPELSESLEAPEVPAFEEEDVITPIEVRPPPKKLGVVASAADESYGSLLDSVFAEISGKDEKQQPPEEVEQDSLLDSVFDEINPSAKSRGSVKGKSKSVIEESAAGDEDEDGGLLDSVFSQIGKSPAPASSTAPRITSSAADLNELSKPLSRVQSPVVAEKSKKVAAAEDPLESEVDRLFNVLDVSKADARKPAPKVVPIVGPEMPALQNQNQNVRARHMSKSFNPGAIAAVDLNTIRVGRMSSSLQQPAKKQDDAGDVASLRRALRTAKAKTTETQSHTLYDLGQKNPPSQMRLWDVKGLVLVGGDQVHLRTLGSDEKFGVISEPGVKVSFLEPGTDRLWLAGKDNVIKVYELLKLDQGPAILTSHAQWVAAIEQYSPEIVASASADRTIRLWKYPSKKSSVLKGHLDYVTCLSTVADPDGGAPLLVSGSCDKTIRFWNCATLQEVRCLFGHQGWVWSLCVDEKNHLWSSGRDLKLCRWDVKTGDCVKEMKLEANVTKLLLHDKTLYAVDEALVITLIRKGKPFRKLSGHTGKIRALVFLGDFAFSAGDDRTIRKWDGRRGQCVEVMKGHRDAITDLRAIPDMGKLLSCSDDGTVREWKFESTRQMKSSGNESSELHAEVERAKFRDLMQDPLYRAAAVCQAIIRMNIVRKSIQQNKLLLKDAKGRYQGLCTLVTFEQNIMAAISQFLSGFLVPVRTFYSRRVKDAAELPYPADQLNAFADALYATYLYHSSVLEKLEQEKEDYPFCINTGHILESDQSVGQLYVLLLDFFPLLVDMSLALGDVTKSSFLETVEQDQGVRLDHGAVRSLLWALPKYWSQVRVPVMQILRFTPSNSVQVDAPLLTLALTRFSVLESVVRITTSYLSNRQRFQHIVHRNAPSDVAAVDKSFMISPGNVLLDETVTIKTRLKKEHARLLVSSNVMILFTETGNPKKEKVMEVVELSNISQALLQADTKEVLISTEDARKRSNPSAVTNALGNSRVLVLQDHLKSEAVRKEIDHASSLAKFSVTVLELESQVEESKKARLTGADKVILPDFPVILMQFLSRSDAVALAGLFNLPCSELKITSLFNAYNEVRDAGQRAPALAGVLAIAGLQNVFSALLEYFLKLPSGFLDAEARRTFLAATSPADFRKALTKVKPIAKDLLGYFVWFLAGKFLPCLFRSNYEDPLSVLGAVCVPAFFWDPKESRRLVMDSTRAHTACKNMLSWYQDIFPSMDVPQVVSFSETKVDVESLKRMAKERYEAEEAERARLVELKEQSKFEGVKNASIESEEEKKRKAQLEEMINEQKADFERKQLELQKERIQGEGAFENLKRQQAQAKARAEAKMRQLKEKSLSSSSKSLSEASLSHILGNLDGKSDATGASAGTSTSSSSLVQQYSQEAQTKPAPKIRIPELVLTPLQKKMIIIIPKLPDLPKRQ